MFPPETTQTIFPSPARPGERRCRRQGAGSLRDHPNALGKDPDRVGDLVQ